MYGVKCFLTCGEREREGGGGGGRESKGKGEDQWRKAGLLVDTNHGTEIVESFWLPFI